MWDVRLLPYALINPLISNLQTVCREVRGQTSLFSWGKKVENSPEKGKPLSKSFSKDVQNIFIGFMVDLLGSYRTFLSDTSEKASFDRIRFTQSQPAGMRTYLSLIVQSQMFAVFIEERHKRYVMSGKFEKRVRRRESLFVTDNGIAKLKEGQSADPINAAPDVLRRTRFTMYENGEINREDITKSLRDMERLEEERKRRELAQNNGAGNTNPGNSQTISCFLFWSVTKVFIFLWNRNDKHLGQIVWVQGGKWTGGASNQQAWEFQKSNRCATKEFDAMWEPKCATAESATTTTTSKAPVYQGLSSYFLRRFDAHSVSCTSVKNWRQSRGLIRWWWWWWWTAWWPPANTSCGGWGLEQGGRRGGGKCNPRPGTHCTKRKRTERDHHHHRQRWQRLGGCCWQYRFSWKCICTQRHHLWRYIYFT